MSSSPAIVYLVTGANRGIGLELVKHILEKRSDAFVYAAARDPTNATTLKEVATRYHGRVSIVKCVSSDEGDATEIAKEIKERHGRIDTVIANAGFGSMEYTALETPMKLYEELFAVNALGPMVLFQAVQDLLKASQSPRFVPISTAGASTGSPMMAFPFRIAAYGASKAALNHLTRKIHFENEWLITFPLAPGAVETETMKNQFQSDKTGFALGMLEKIETLKPQEAAVSLVKIIDEATREKDGGEFINVDGTKLLW